MRVEMMLFPFGRTNGLTWANFALRYIQNIDLRVKGVFLWCLLAFWQLIRLKSKCLRIFVDEGGDEWWWMKIPWFGVFPFFFKKMGRIVILRLESLTSYRYVHPLKARRYNFLHNLEFTCQNIRTFSGFIGTVLLWSYRLS